jgi:peptide/nickel transport system substrate-binding protein
MEWLKNNESGGGAYRVEKWIPGHELTYRRVDDWAMGFLMDRVTPATARKLP